MRKSDRLFQLTNILRRHQPLTAKQLSEKLRVSERTIYRYVDDLSLAGIPIYGEAGVGYRLAKGFELPPLQLSSSELEALITGVSFTASLTGKDLAASAHSLLSKIEAALPDVPASHDKLERTIRIPANQNLSMNSIKWNTIHSAINCKRWLEVGYHSLENKTSARTVFPLGLFYWGGKWTLGCWCNLRKDYRDLRLDRITNLNNSDSSFRLPSHVTLATYISAKTKKH